jgi:hypothetical protein
MEIIALFEKLLSFKSITPDDDGAFDFIQEYMDISIINNKDYKYSVYQNSEIITNHYPFEEFHLPVQGISYQIPYSLKYIPSRDKTILCIKERITRRVSPVKFQKLAKKYGDTNYNGYHFFKGGACIIDTIKNISIICNKQYDEKHPKGSVLNDIIDIRYTDAKIGLNDKTKSYDPFNYMIKEKLKTFNQRKDKFLIGSYFDFYFIKAPDKKGEYTFTLHYNYKIKDRTQFKIEFDPIKIKGKN